MKTPEILPVIALAAAMSLGGSQAARSASFTSGNLAVVRIGDGSVVPLANNGTNIFILEYTTTGALVQTISIPATGPNALVASGSATSEGALARSPNGRWLCFAGYNTNAGGGGIANSSSLTAPRAVATLDAAGNYVLIATVTNQFSANNIRSGATDGTNNFWGAGGTSGTYYFGTASGNAVQSSIANTRVLQVFNGNLYFSTASGTARGIYGFNPAGLPVTSASTNFLINAGAASSVYGFSISPDGLSAYIVDDSAPTSGGGIHRWTNSAGVWSFVYTANTNAARGLAVDWSGVNPVLYATTTTNSLIAVTDTGASSTATLLVSGASGTALRGIALAPLAGPSISSQPQSLTANASSNASFSVTAEGPGPLTYQWRKNGANLDGQTSSTLTLNNVSGSDAAGYDVIVANSVYAITSSVATLTVNYVINIAVTNRVYSAYRTDLPADAWVYVDADPAAGTPVRATQRCLGYREVDYKSHVPGTLAFTPVTPTTNGNTVTYDYSAQVAKTFTVGFWVDKNVPIIIGPDGNAYITDGHHTTAGLLAPISPVRQLVPGKNRVILGHIVANYYNPMSSAAPDDSWWSARQSENNALLYGPDGDQLTLSGEPNYSSLQPILPSVLAMPTTPSTLTTNGAVAMTPSIYRALTWGLADAIVVSATDSANKKIAGYKKSAPGSSVDINFVEFFWADYLRHRIVWDDTLSGSPYGSTNGDASVVAAPLSFFTAVANGIALARSQAYLDEYGRNLTNYTNGATFTANTVNWANGSLSNGLAAATDTYHLYLRDDSSIAGTISPSPLSTNILHIDTVAGITVTQTLQNIRSILVNAGGTLNTAWKDATVSNSTLRLPAGTGTVRFETTLQGAISVANGTFGGSGTVNGSLTIQSQATLAPGASIGTLTVNGPLSCSGATVMEVNKTGLTLTGDLVTGISTLTYGGSLTIVATGDALTAGDSFNLFDATTYAGAFGSLNLPALDPGLAWDTSQLIVDGTLRVVSSSVALAIATQPQSQTANVGATVTLISGAVGSAPITNQWRFNGSDLGGQTGSSLTLANIQEANQGLYTFVAQNAAGAVTSTVATLIVNQAPTAQAQSVALAWNSSIGITLGGGDLDGDSLSFIVTVQPTHGTVTGTAPNLTYTPTANYSGPDSLTFRVSDGVLSATAVVSITVQPGFTYKDTDLLLVFRKDGASDVLFNLGNVSNYINQSQGAMNNISFNTNLVLATYGGSYTGVKYALMAVTPLDSSPLRAWLSDADGSGAPRDETFSRWGGQRSKISQIGGGATQYFHSSNQSLVLPSTDPGSYTYIASDGGSLDVSTMGGTSPFPVEQDVPGHLRLIELKVSTANPKPLAVQAGSVDLSLTGGGSLKFTAGVTAPVFTVQPSNQSGGCGGSSTFSAAASGDGPVSYQWYAGASPIGGATDSSVTLSPLTLGSAGSYSVVAGTAGGSTTSSVVMLTVADTLPPALSLPSNITATRDSAGGKVVTYSASANDACAGSVAVNCAPASGSTFPLGVTTVNCSANDGNGNTANGSFTVSVISGFTYKDTDLLLVFRKDGASDVLFNLGNVSNYINQSQGAMNNISFNTNLVLATYGGSYTGVKYALMAVTPLDSSPLRAWLSDADGSGAPRDETFSRWGGQRSKISQIGGGATQYFHSSNQSLVLPSTDPGSYTYIASDGGSLDVSTMGGTSPFPVEQDVPGHLRLIELKVSTANPKPLAVQAGSLDLSLAGGGSANLKFTAGVTAPVLTSQPANVLAACGGTATFSVSATGDGPLSYQWYRGATAISGATDSTLVISPVVGASAGSYTVEVSNAGGATASSAAMLSATEPAVALAVSKFGTNVVLSWPQTCVTYTLEGTLELTPPASSWVPVGVAPTAGGGQWMVTLPASATNAFFRLRYP